MYWEWFWTGVLLCIHFLVTILYWVTIHQNCTPSCLSRFEGRAPSSHLLRAPSTELVVGLLAYSQLRLDARELGRLPGDSEQLH